jgi:two-component system, LytTR family, response regulator AgrA
LFRIVQIFPSIKLIFRSDKVVIFLNIIICEDRQEYIKEISRITKLFFEDSHVNCKINSFNNYENTINYIKSLNSYEDCLYILDIDLKQDKNGLLLGREIRNIDDYKGEMIYITSYTHQMNNVFKYKLRILDFIDKSYNMENNLKEALNAYLKIYRNKAENEVLVFKVGAEVIKVKPLDIISIETDKHKKKIIMHTTKGEISINLTLKEIKEKLTDDFIQIHRCIIVNKKHIKKIEDVNKDLNVILTGDIKEPISKRREKEIKTCITQ